MKLPNLRTAFAPLEAYVYWLINKDDIQNHVQREEEIVRVMAVLPAHTRYHARPTFDQIKRIVEEVETTTTHNATSLYQALCLGSIPEDIDTIIARHAQGWAPVEGGLA